MTQKEAARAVASHQQTTKGGRFDMGKGNLDRLPKYDGHSPLASTAEELARVAAQLGQSAAAMQYEGGAEAEASRSGLSAPRHPGAIWTVGMFAQRLILERRQRDAVLGTELFGEPAWDILLDLFAAQENFGRPLNVSSLCVAASVPSTTALRWINIMIERGVLVRRPDTADRRRVWIELAPRVHQQMRALLSSWMNQAGG